jgi:hypothetical protein
MGADEIYESRWITSQTNFKKQTSLGIQQAESITGIYAQFSGNLIIRSLYQINSRNSRLKYPGFWSETHNFSPLPLIRATSYPPQAS